MFVGRKKDELP